MKIYLPPCFSTAQFKEVSTMTKITEIEGIGSNYAQKLSGIGITTTEALLKQGASKKGRKEIAEKSGIADKLILKWVNRADLARIKGIGEEYADLLEVAGVDTVPELAQRKAENLYNKMVEVDSEKKLVRQVPAQSKVEDWVKQAKGLDRVVTY
jgi:predicted flap endonuclease-1-like 5' DNA nuclease